MPRTVLRSATKRPVRYSAKWRRWHSLAKRSAYWARASWTSLGNSIIPGMSRCSGVQLRQGKMGGNRVRLPYFYSLDRHFAKGQVEVGRASAGQDRRRVDLDRPGVRTKDDLLVGADQV